MEVVEIADGLRPCVVDIPEIKEYWYSAGEKIGECVTREKEHHEALFHRWDSGDLAIVEYEDGSVHRIKPEHIIFTDRL